MLSIIIINCLRRPHKFLKGSSTTLKILLIHCEIAGFYFFHFEMRYGLVIDIYRGRIKRMRFRLKVIFFGTENSQYYLRSIYRESKYNKNNIH